MSEVRKILDKLKFIDLVKARPWIYDRKNHLYRRAYHMHDAWAEIAVEMDTTVSVCKKQWLSLRNQLRINLKMAQRSSTFSENVQTKFIKPSWHLYERLEFLVPHLTHRPRTGAYRLPDIDMQAVQQVKDALDCTTSSSNNADSSTSQRPHETTQVTLSAVNMISTSKNDNSQDHDPPIIMITDDEYDSQDLVTSSNVDGNNPTQLFENAATSTADFEIRRQLLAMLESDQMEGEHDLQRFYKCLLDRIRDIDKRFAMALRCDLMVVVAKYLSMSQHIDEFAQTLESVGYAAD